LSFYSIAEFGIAPSANPIFQKLHARKSSKGNWEVMFGGELLAVRSWVNASVHQRLLKKAIQQGRREWGD
jgi:hypothetical protein